MAVQAVVTHDYVFIRVVPPLLLGRVFLIWIIEDRTVLFQRDFVDINLAAVDPNVFARKADDPFHVDTVEPHGVAVHHDVAAFQRAEGARRPRQQHVLAVVQGGQHAVPFNLVGPRAEEVDEGLIDRHGQAVVYQLDGAFPLCMGAVPPPKDAHTHNMAKADRAVHIPDGGCWTRL